MNFNKELLEKGIVFLRPNDPFTWSSGIKSPIYCDNRLILGYPKLRKNVAQRIATDITNNFPDVEIVMGTSTAGIPHGTLVADILDLPCGYVRGGKKAHGRGNQVEGACVKGKKVVVVEDLISTGKSSLEVVDTLREAGAIVLGVSAIFSYNMKIAEQKFGEYNLKYTIISDIDKLLEYSLENNLLDKRDTLSVKEFLNDPTSWMKK